MANIVEFDNLDTFFEVRDKINTSLRNLNEVKLETVPVDDDSLTLSNDKISVNNGGINLTHLSETLLLKEPTTIYLNRGDDLQAKINAVPKNLNGYKLTFVFTDNDEKYIITDKLLFWGFYGGTVQITDEVGEVDINEYSLSVNKNVNIECHEDYVDPTTATPAIQLHTNCVVTITNIAIRYNSGSQQYGILCTAGTYNIWGCVSGSTFSGSSGALTISFMIHYSNVSIKDCYSSNCKEAIRAQNSTVSVIGCSGLTSTIYYALVAEYGGVLGSDVETIANFTTGIRGSVEEERTGGIVNYNKTPSKPGVWSYVNTGHNVTYTVPSNTTHLKIIATGPGHSLCQAYGGGYYSRHSTGGAGATAIKYLAVTPGQTFSVYVGKVDGSDTTVSWQIGEEWETVRAGKALDSRGGTATGGDLNIPGGYGGVDTSDGGAEESQGAGSYWGTTPAWGGGASGHAGKTVVNAASGIVVIESY